MHNDIVNGLKYCNIVRRTGLIVDKQEEVLGCFAPNKAEHVVLLSIQEAPSGFFYRGAYHGKSMFVDGDGQIHLMFTYNFRIMKEW